MEPDACRFHLYFTTPDASAAPYVMRMAEGMKEMTSELVGVPRLFTFSSVSAPAVLHVCFRYPLGELALVHQLESAVAWMKAQPVSTMYSLNVATIKLARQELVVEAEQVDPYGPRWSAHGALHSWTLPPVESGGASSCVAASMLDWLAYCTSGKGDMRTLFPVVARHHVMEELPMPPMIPTPPAQELVGGDLSAFYSLLNDMESPQVDVDALFFHGLLPHFTPPEELRVGDWVAYINPDEAWAVVCTQIVGFDLSKPCPLKLQNLEHLKKVKDEELAFARFDPATNSLTSKLALISAYRLVY